MKNDRVCSLSVAIRSRAWWVVIAAAGCTSSAVGGNGPLGSHTSEASTSEASAGDGGEESDDDASGMTVGVTSDGDPATSGEGTTGDGTSADEGATGATTEPVAIFFEDFEDYSLPGSFGFGSQMGGSVTIADDPAQTYGASSGSVRGTYPQQTGGGGGVFIWGSVNTWDHTESDNHLYVRFAAKMPGAVKHGCKFLKVFGFNPRDNDLTGFDADIEANYANTTFGLDYTGEGNGALLTIGFGDGSSTTNDTAAIVRLDGSNPELAGRAFGLPGFSISTPNGPWLAADWGDDWHLFEFYVKFNSGDSPRTEVNDGELGLRIDGLVYLEARGLFNRHWSNLPIEDIGIYNQSQGSSDGQFELWYDNLEITQQAWGSEG
ncbi:MAG: hypothetical protein KUG77_25945 [Nannocystaceae bacterium]|nr:hypothetical protein [Nannocystaceae bacterium]